MTLRMSTVYAYLVSGPLRVMDTLALWRDRSDGRRRLMVLDEHMLSDIGFNRADAERVARTPFWKP